MNNRKKDCSKYKEETKRKLSIERRKKSNKNEEHCQEQKSMCDKCLKKKMKNIKSCMSQNELTYKDLLSKIKPPLSVREKYSNPQHVVCFAEKAQNSRKQNGIIYTTAEEETQNSWCKTISEEKLSSELKCDSVCSFDSTIDLEGLSLTTKDLKKIEKNRRSVHPPKENQEEITEVVEEDNTEGKIEEALT